MLATDRVEQPTDVRRRARRARPGASRGAALRPIRSTAPDATDVVDRRVDEPARRSALPRRAARRRRPRARRRSARRPPAAPRRGTARARRSPHRASVDRTAGSIAHPPMIGRRRRRAHEPRARRRRRRRPARASEQRRQVAGCGAEAGLAGAARRVGGLARRQVEHEAAGDGLRACPPPARRCDRRPRARAGATCASARTLAPPGSSAVRRRGTARARRPRRRRRTP